MSDVSKLIKKVNELLDLLKADPRTKLPGVLINKAAPAPAPASPAPVKPAAPKMNAPKSPKLPKPSIPSPSPKMPSMQMSMDKTLSASEKDPQHLAKWMKKAVGCMHKSSMYKNDEEKQRMTDPNVANVRREEVQEEQRSEHDEQVKTHASTVKAKKDDAIKQDKGKKPIKAVKKSEPLSKPAPKGVSKEKFDSCVEQVKDKGGAKNAYAVCNASLAKDNPAPNSFGNLTSNSPAMVKNTASAPVSRPDAGFGAVIVKDDAPHAPGTGEHSAHEIVEHGHTVPQEINKLPNKEVSRMLSHLRSFAQSRDKAGWKRSPGNKR